MSLAVVSIIPRTRRSKVFPYTTLFRSAGSSIIWNRFATKPEYIFGVNRFGMSGKTDEVIRYLKIDKNTILEKIANYLRSEEHTSELQSRFDLVCRLLLEKKKIYLRRDR